MSTARIQEKNIIFLYFPGASEPDSGGYKQEDADFIKAILTKTDPLCTIADAAKSLELAERLMRTTI